jgi:hypothetical protein
VWGARVGIAVALMTLAASLHVLLHLALDRYDCACACAVRVHVHVRVRVRVRVYGMCACVWYVCLGRCARVCIYIYEYVYAHMYINMYIVCICICIIFKHAPADFISRCIAFFFKVSFLWCVYVDVLLAYCRCLLSNLR